MTHLSRRQFLKTAAVATSAAAMGRRLTAADAPAILPERSPNSKIATACIAVAGQAALTSARRKARGWSPSATWTSARSTGFVRKS